MVEEEQLPSALGFRGVRRCRGRRGAKGAGEVGQRELRGPGNLPEGGEGLEQFGEQASAVEEAQVRRFSWCRLWFRVRIGLLSCSGSSVSLSAASCSPSSSAAAPAAPAFALASGPRGRRPGRQRQRARFGFGSLSWFRSGFLACGCGGFGLVLLGLFAFLTVVFVAVVGSEASKVYTLDVANRTSSRQESPKSS